MVVPDKTDKTLSPLYYRLLEDIDDGDYPTDDVLCKLTDYELSKLFEIMDPDK